MPEAPKAFSVAENNKRKLDFIEDVTKNADQIQKQVLAEILSRNAEVEYLKRHGLNGHIDRDTFKKTMPVISYEDILPDINRIANGDTSPILCSDRISEFLTRSAPPLSLSLKMLLLFAYVFFTHSEFGVWRINKRNKSVLDS